jgi:hypothetical protein
VTPRLVPLRPMRAGRVGHAAIALADGRVLVAGGVTATGSTASAVASCEVYEPDSGAWRVATRLQVPRQDLALARLADGRVLAIGGRVLDRTPLATIEAWDPRTDRWERLPDLPEAVWGAQVAVMDAARALVVGGFAAVGPSRVAWWIDLASGALAPAPATTSEHAYHAVATTTDGAVIVSGLATEVLRGERWTILARPGAGADAAAIAVLADGAIVVGGGRDGEDEHARDDVAIWPRDLGAPTATRFAGGGRWGHTFARLGDGTLVAVGGVAGSPLRFVDTWESFDPASRAWRREPALVEARWRHAQVTLADGATIVVGGAGDPRAGAALPTAIRLTTA